MAVQSQSLRTRWYASRDRVAARPWRATGGLCSILTATARTRSPTATITVISRTPPAGEVTMTRLTRGLWPAHNIGPSWLIRRRACCVVQGTIWLAGLDPASVSASTWANLLGHPPAAGAWSAVLA